jgi:uncharacterized RDD family membrane protein YckC
MSENIETHSDQRNRIGVIAGGSSGIYTESNPIKINYAGFWRRVFATIIDLLVVAWAQVILFFLLFFGLLFWVVDPNNLEIIMYELFILGPFVSYLPTFWLYSTIMESSAMRATLGKIAMGIVVTDERYRRISFARANGRFWSKAISTFTLLIGFIMAAFTKKKQALHDIIAGTVAIRKDNIS